MARPGARRARSLYKGIRATITTSPTSPFGFLSVSTKQQDTAWAEWDQVTTVRRIDLSEVRSTPDALYRLSAALYELAEDLEQLK